jgi:hypothetical protein
MKQYRNSHIFIYLNIVRSWAGLFLVCFDISSKCHLGSILRKIAGGSFIAKSHALSSVL